MDWIESLVLKIKTSLGIQNIIGAVWDLTFLLTSSFPALRLFAGPQWDCQSIKMSMVVFASVVRVGDGLPLSASTDYEQDKELQETKRHLKGLSKKLSQFPDRCTLKSGPYNIK